MIPIKSKMKLTEIKREIKGRLKKTIGFLLIKIFLQDQIKVNTETAKPKMSIRDTIL